MKKVLFIFDKVAHYHRDVFTHLEALLLQRGCSLHLLSGVTSEGEVGRVGLKGQVINNEFKYYYKEIRFGSYTLRTQSGVVKAISELRPDCVVIMSHVGNFMYWLLLVYKRIYKFKIVSWQCGYEYNPGKIKDVLLRAFIPQFDHHLAYHTNAGKYALRHGASPDEVTVMYNTINDNKIIRMNKESARTKLIKKHPSINGKNVILYVGAILIEKKLEMLVEALDMMGRSDTVLLIVGDGPHMPELKKRCQHRDDVILTGAVIQGVGLYFDAADLYVLPGTGGLGINEAMSHGLPIVSGFADGSADDLVLDGQNGYRLRTDTAEELKDKMRKLLDNSERRLEMGEKSFEMIKNKFSFNKFVGTVGDVLSNI